MIIGSDVHPRFQQIASVDAETGECAERRKPVRAAAEADPQARLLMTHPGVGPVVSLAYVLAIGDWQRFPRGKQVGVIWV
jgi:transposase